MNIRHWLCSAALCASIVGIPLGAAAEINPNSADLKYAASIPPMQIAINPGGVGCTGVQTWDPSAGRCTEAEFIRNTASVVQVVPSPASVPAGGASTLSGYVRDGLGRPVPSGILVQWATSFGSISAGASYTNAAGIASAVVSSAAAGTATVYAKTTVSGNAVSNVSFTSTNPIVEGFNVSCRAVKKTYAGKVCVDTSYGLNQYVSSTFSWSVKGAVRYTLENDGRVFYSGADNSFTINGYDDTGVSVWTLKAYSGPDESGVTTISVDFPYQAISNEAQTG